jgi:predicted nucleic acid-binding protein
MAFVAKVLDEVPKISVITEIEALSWVNTDKTKEAVISEFVQDVSVFPLTQEIVNQCIKIRRSRKIRTPDAIIAATALVNDLILITSDSDFRNIPGLKISDPKSL